MQDLSRLIDWVTAIKDRRRHPPSVDVQSGAVRRLFVDMLSARSDYVSSQAHHELLNRSILTSLVAFFEVLLSDLTHAFYQLVPGAASNGDKVLSVNELRSFESIDEAMEFVVSRRVDDLLRGDIADWHDFLNSRLKISLRQLVPDWAQWSEVFQRRHIILHAGGRATRRYVDKVDWQRVTWPEVAPRLEAQVPIDDAYLESVIDLFEVSGLLLCQAVWKKLVPAQTDTRLSADPVGGLTGAIYRRLLTGHWYVAEHLSQWGASDELADEGRRLICTFNRWLAVKRQGRWSEIRDEVEAFDCSAKDPKFWLAFASLTERPDNFFQHLPAALAGGVTPEELREWPILEEVRGDARFEEALTKAEERGPPSIQGSSSEP